jgi:rubrerythrin
VEAALRIVLEEVLEEEARHNVLVEEVGDHILAGLQSPSVTSSSLNH